MKNLKIFGMKENEARILLNCGYSLHISDFDKEFLGKKIIKWNVPYDLHELADKTQKAYIGLGRWLNTKEYYICIALPNQAPMYFNVEATKRLLKGAFK